MKLVVVTILEVDEARPHPAFPPHAVGRKARLREGDGRRRDALTMMETRPADREEMLTRTHRLTGGAAKGMRVGGDVKEGVGEEE